MKDKILNNKTHVIVFSSLFIILVFFYVVLYLINKDIIKMYDNRVLPSIYLDEVDVSNYTFEEMYDELKSRNDKILSKRVLLSSKGKEINVSLKELGLCIDVDNTLKRIKNYQKYMSYPQKLWYINGHNSKKKLNLVFKIDDNSFTNYFQILENNMNIQPTNGYFDASVGVKYVPGTDGFKLNYDKNKTIINDYFNGNYDDLKIELTGDVVKAHSEERYMGIDTMTSSFVTEYDTWVTLRAQNLRTGVSYINGAIVEPGEIFSFYSYAGPYNKAGFVFYYEFVGNGVCQVATTTYDAALLGGHEIITRTPHKKKSVYVDGGLDATVASANDGSWNTDMQFRNVYDYPIYIKAYDTYGEIHVEFWSNKDAKKGKEYSIDSSWLGGRGYRAFRHTFENGVETNTEVINTTWYPED